MIRMIRAFGAVEVDDNADLPQLGGDAAQKLGTPVRPRFRTVGPTLRPLAIKVDAAHVLPVGGSAAVPW